MKAPRITTSFLLLASTMGALANYAASPHDDGGGGGLQGVALPPITLCDEDMAPFSADQFGGWAEPFYEGMRSINTLQGEATEKTIRVCQKLKLQMLRSLLSQNGYGEDLILEEESHYLKEQYHRYMMYVLHANNDTQYTLAIQQLHELYMLGKLKNLPLMDINESTAKEVLDAYLAELNMAGDATQADSEAPPEQFHQAPAPSAWSPHQAQSESPSSRTYAKPPPPASHASYGPSGYTPDELRGLTASPEQINHNSLPYPDPFAHERKAPQNPYGTPPSDAAYDHSGHFRDFTRDFTRSPVPISDDALPYPGSQRRQPVPRAPVYPNAYRTPTPYPTSQHTGSFASSSGSTASEAYGTRAMSGVLQYPQPQPIHSQHSMSRNGSPSTVAHPSQDAFVHDHQLKEVRTYLDTDEKEFPELALENLHNALNTMIIKDDGIGIMVDQKTQWQASPTANGLWNELASRCMQEASTHFHAANLQPVRMTEAIDWVTKALNIVAAHKVDQSTRDDTIRAALEMKARREKTKVRHLIVPKALQAKTIHLDPKLRDLTGALERAQMKQFTQA